MVWGGGIAAIGRRWTLGVWREEKKKNQNFIGEEEDKGEGTKKEKIEKKMSFFKASKER